MQQLLVIGFQLAGHWTPVDDGLEVALLRHAKQKNVLYAFVCDGDLKYVGKTTQTLAKRLYGYKNPGSTQATNLRNHRLIREQLAAGATVEVFVLPDNGLMHYGQFHLNLAAGLEDNIIATLKPEWNNSPTRVEPEDPAPSHPLSEFQITLHPTYFNQGFFNVFVEQEGYFGGHGDHIEIFTGDASTPVIGTINRTSNTNKTPRIFGGLPLRDWFQQVSSVGGRINVSVHTPCEIHLQLSE